MDRVIKYIEERPVRVALALACAFGGVLAHQATAQAGSVSAGVATGNCVVTSTGSFALGAGARGATLTVGTYVSRFVGQRRSLVYSQSYIIPRAVRSGTRSYRFSVPRTRNGWRYSTIATIRITTPRGATSAKADSGDRALTCR